jgi:hypothetical protein
LKERFSHLIPLPTVLLCVSAKYLLLLFTFPIQIHTLTSVNLYDYHKLIIFVLVIHVLSVYVDKISREPFHLDCFQRSQLPHPKDHFCKGGNSDLCTYKRSGPHSTLYQHHASAHARTAGVASCADRRVSHWCRRLAGGPGHLQFSL